MATQIAGVRPGQLSLQLDPDADPSDPRILQVATYGIVPEPGASPAAVRAVLAPGAGLVVLAHDATDIGRSYTLQVGPIASVSGTDLPPISLPLLGAGAFAAMSAEALPRDGYALTLAPADLGARLGTKNVAVLPSVPYPIHPELTSAALQPDRTLQVRGSGWTEVPYDLAAGAARFRSFAEASLAGAAQVSGSEVELRPGGRVALGGVLPGTAAVFDVRVRPRGSFGDVLAQLDAGGHSVQVRAVLAPDGFWEVYAQGAQARTLGTLTLRVSTNAAATHFGVFVDGLLVAGGAAAGLPPGAGGASVSCGAGDLVSASGWLSEVSLLDAGGNPLLALALGVAPPPAAPVARELRTKKRPLTAPLGPHVPAEPGDVVLTVGGARVEVASVNPYLGIVSPKIPIPRGTRSVSVEYETAAHQAFSVLAGEPGLEAGEAASPFGPDTGQPFTVVLPRPRRPRPPRYAHRYLAFRRVTSSLLNDPVGLRAGRDPAVPQPPPLVRARPPVDLWARTAGEAVSPPWAAQGSGQVVPAAGGFSTEPQPGPFLLVQEADLRDVAGAYLTARLDPGPVSTLPFQVGAALGFHDESRLYALAVLDSLGARYLGTLLDPSAPGNLESWSVWPRAQVRATSRQTVAARPADLPRLLEVGDRLRIPDGPQAGSYLVVGLRPSWPSGTTEIDLDRPLPADPTQYGARDATAWFDLGSGTLVLRAEADLQAGTLQVSAAGRRAVLAADPAPRPAPSPLFQQLAPGQPPGRFFFGHLAPSPPATWGTVIGAAQPASNPVRIKTQSLPGPAALPDPQWAPLGLVRVDPTGTYATGTQSPGGLLHPDRAIGPDALTSLDFTVQELLGGGTLDVQVELGDGQKLVFLASLTYDEVPGRQPYRQLVAPAHLLFDPLGWEVEGPGTCEGGVLWVPPLQSARWSAALPAPGGRILDLEMQPPRQRGASVLIHVEGGSGSGLAATLEITSSSLRVLAQGGSEVGSRDLGLGARITATLQPGVGMVLMVDGSLVPMLAPVLELAAPQVDGVVSVTLSSSSRHQAASCGLQRLVVLQSSPTAKRTLGLLRGDLDTSDLDSWELPRTDASTQPNSAESGPAIREMDARGALGCRLVLDPVWGAILLRPDLPPPPYYDPAKSRFAGDLSEPSAGWASVPYDSLPSAPAGATYQWLAAGPGARVLFTSVQTQVKARSAPGEVGFVPRSELNHADPADSGDHSLSPYPAQVRAHRVSARAATIAGSGQWLRTLLEVVDGARRILPPDVRLDPDGQSIHLEDGSSFSSPAPLARGTPALPATEAYLRALPVRGSPNEVGEGTPPIFPRYFSQPLPQVVPDPDSTGRAVEFPEPPASKPLLLREAFTVEDPGQRDLTSFPSDDPGEGGNAGNGPPGPPGPPPDGGGPVIVLGGGLYWDRFPFVDDGTYREPAWLGGPFRPAGGRHPGTPTIDVPPYRAAAVLLPARGRWGRSNPDISLTGPGGVPIPLPEDPFGIAAAGTLRIELDDHGTKTLFTFSE